MGIKFSTSNSTNNHNDLTPAQLEKLLSRAVARASVLSLGWPIELEKQLRVEFGPAVNNNLLTTIITTTRDHTKSTSLANSISPLNLNLTLNRVEGRNGDESQPAQALFTLPTMRVYQEEVEITGSVPLHSSRFFRVVRENFRAELNRLRQARLHYQLSTLEGELIEAEVERCVAVAVAGTDVGVGQPRFLIHLHAQLDGLGPVKLLLPPAEQIPVKLPSTMLLAPVQVGQKLLVYPLRLEVGLAGGRWIVSQRRSELVGALVEQHLSDFEVKAVARQSGVKSKVAVVTRAGGAKLRLDPAHSHEGSPALAPALVKGLALISQALPAPEEIELVEWSSNLTSFIRRALAPANPKLHRKLERAKVNLGLMTTMTNYTAHSNQVESEGQGQSQARLGGAGRRWAEVEVSHLGLSEAERQELLGPDGLNVRLVSWLTGWHIRLV